jgi:hypothetical protein
MEYQVFPITFDEETIHSLIGVLGSLDKKSVDYICMG